MKAAGWFKVEHKKAAESFDYKLAKLEMSVTEEIIGLMEERNISRKGLADVLKVSKAAVSKLLNNGSNLTLKRLLTIAEALGYSLQVKFTPKDTASKSIQGRCAAGSAKAVSKIVSYEPKIFAQQQLTVNLVSASYSDDYLKARGWDNAVDAA